MRKFRPHGTPVKHDKHIFQSLNYGCQSVFSAGRIGPSLDPVTRSPRSVPSVGRTCRSVPLLGPVGRPRRPAPSALPVCRSRQLVPSVDRSRQSVGPVSRSVPSVGRFRQSYMHKLKQRLVGTHIHNSAAQLRSRRVLIKNIRVLIKNI